VHDEREGCSWIEAADVGGTAGHVEAMRVLVDAVVGASETARSTSAKVVSTSGVPLFTNLPVFNRPHPHRLSSCPSPRPPLLLSRCNLASQLGCRASPTQK
jgi:hypothetical protein